jgi:hypothetical protein
MSSPSGNKRKRAAFLAAANQIAVITDKAGVLDKPWQDWFEKVCFRLARVFVPELPLTDFQQNPEKFFGTLAGLQMDVAKHFEAADLTEFSATPALRKLRQQFRAAIKADHDAIKETQSRAMDLPVAGRLTFNAALGTTVKNELAAQVIQRIQTSPTVKICLFLILNRRAIEERKFGTAGKCFEAFRKTSFGREGLAGNGDPMLSMKAQFQKICSESGVRFSNRGRPRANLD